MICDTSIIANVTLKVNDGIAHLKWQTTWSFSTVDLIIIIIMRCITSIIMKLQWTVIRNSKLGQISSRGHVMRHSTVKANGSTIMNMDTRDSKRFCIDHIRQELFRYASMYGAFSSIRMEFSQDIVSFIPLSHLTQHHISGCYPV